MTELLLLFLKLFGIEFANVEEVLFEILNEEFKLFLHLFVNFLYTIVTLV